MSQRKPRNRLIRRMTVSLSTDEYSRLIDKAETEGASAAWVMRRALLRLLAQGEPAQSTVEGSKHV
jgi:hypothetical protein